MVVVVGVVVKDVVPEVVCVDVLVVVVSVVVKVVVVWVDVGVVVVVVGSVWQIGPLYPSSQVQLNLAESNVFAQVPLPEHVCSAVVSATWYGRSSGSSPSSPPQKSITASHTLPGDQNRV